MFIVQGAKRSLLQYLSFHWSSRLQPVFPENIILRKSFGPKGFQFLLIAIPLTALQVTQLGKTMKSFDWCYTRNHPINSGIVLWWTWQGPNPDIRLTGWEVGYTSGFCWFCSISWLTNFARSRIHHIKSLTPNENSTADIILKEYQEQASTGKLAFRRWPMRSVSIVCRSSERRWWY